MKLPKQVYKEDDRFYFVVLSRYSFFTYMIRHPPPSLILQRLSITAKRYLRLIPPGFHRDNRAKE